MIGLPVSCVVPVFNQATYIEETLRSIYSQTYRPIDVIVVDDGSDDGTGEVVLSLGLPLTYIRQQHSGQARARNRGILETRSHYIAFLDADDLWAPEKLTIQVAELQANPEYGASVTLMRKIWNDELQSEAQRFRDHPRAQALPGYTFSTLLARRTAFETVGLLDGTSVYAPQLDWFVRPRQRNLHVALLPQLLAFHRQHPANMTRGGISDFRTEILDIIAGSMRDRKRKANPSE